MAFLCAGLVLVLGALAWSIWCGARHGGAWWWVVAPPITAVLLIAAGAFASVSATVRGLTSGTQRNLEAENLAATGNILLALAALMTLASLATNIVASVRSPQRDSTISR